MARGAKRFMTSVDLSLLEMGELDGDENLEGILIETLEEVLADLEEGKTEIELNREQHALVSELIKVNTKLKMMAQKVRPTTIPLPKNAREVMDMAAKKPRLRPKRKIGHKFTKKTLEKLRIGADELLSVQEKEAFEAMILEHGKAFLFSMEEVGCVDPSLITPMMVFIVPHVPWDLKPIVVPRALAPKLAELLNEKLKA
ncbi:unnamed protein product [Calypogeia fissa]